MQLDLSNQAIHQRWDFDFTSDGCINQTRPNIGAATTDEEGYIQTYRRYPLQGNEVQVTPVTTFTPIE